MRTLQPLWMLGYGQQQSHIAPRRHDIGPGAYAGRRDVVTDAKGTFTNGERLPEGGEFTGGSWILVTTDILGGHSGGPVVDSSGAVLGWAVQSLYDKAHPEVKENNGGLHAARPIHEARPMLDKIIAAQPAP